MGADNDITNDQLILDIEVGKNNRQPVTAPNPLKPNAPTFISIQSGIAKCLIVDKDTDYLLDIILASCLSVELDRPLFMMIQGASSSGKSEYLKLFDRIKDFHKQYCLTPKTLFSGHSDADGGYIPAVIGRKGILCIPDFTTVLSAGSRDRAEIFSQIRIAYDGEGGRSTGVDVKNIPNRQWRGKIACIFAVTDKIEHFKNNASDLGERFLYYRHNTVDLSEDDMLVWSKHKSEVNIIKIQTNIKKLLSAGVKLLKNLEITDKDKRYIFSSAKLIARLRAVVDRDGRTRQINLIHPPEEPFRLQNQLSGLYKCLKAIHGDDSTRPRLALKAVIESCIPQQRLHIVDFLHDNADILSSEIARAIGLPVTTVLTCLEDMHAQQILTQSTSENYNANAWSLAENFARLLERVRSL